MRCGRVMVYSIGQWTRVAKCLIEPQIYSNNVFGNTTQLKHTKVSNKQSKMCKLKFLND